MINVIEESLSVSDSVVTQNGVSILINGIEYCYRSDIYSDDDLSKKFNGIYKHSQGRALQWIKKIANVIKKG